MKSNPLSIAERCHVNTNDEGDRFVGIKANSGELMVYFPIGYQLPNNEKDVRRDIMHLIFVLDEFTEKKNKVFQGSKVKRVDRVDFPINSYIYIINHFLEQNGKYYVETDYKYETRAKGRAIWGRTIKNQRPIIQENGSPIYTSFTVRASTPNMNKLITLIHQYCVYESFKKIGWLFLPSMPTKPEIKFDRKRFLITLNDKMSHTHNDKNKNLFKSMIKMIEFLDDETVDKEFYYGTDYFEVVWERLIDRVYGIRNKQDFFPKTRWQLRNGIDMDKEQYPLEPDSIMIVGDKYYVLDAKYYRFGVSGIPNHLPNSSSINKQITYGEYIHSHKKIPNEKLFNAFIMPFNCHDNVFNVKSTYINIGEATGDWRGENEYNYEKIQGILVDVRYLMHNYIGRSIKPHLDLANSIERS